MIRRTIFEEEILLLEKLDICVSIRESIRLTSRARKWGGKDMWRNEDLAVDEGRYCILSRLDSYVNAREIL